MDVETYNKAERVKWEEEKHFVKSKFIKNDVKIKEVINKR